MKRVLKNILSQLHSFALWALMSILLWGWIFGLATDTSYDKKVMIYCHVPELRDVSVVVVMVQPAASHAVDHVGGSKTDERPCRQAPAILIQPFHIRL